MEKKQPTVPEQSGILSEIGSEVSQENAPLLEFITQHGGKIAGVVLVFLLVTGASGLWSWYHNRQRTTFLEEKARIEMTMTGAEKINALADLAEKVPDSLKSLFYLSLADAASSAKDYARAAEAYAGAARSDADGTTGLMAQLAQIACLLRLDKNEEALNLAQSVATRFENPKPPVLRQMMADAARRKGDTALAARILTEMAQDMPGEDAEYLLYLARKLSRSEKPAQSGQSAAKP